MAASVAQRPLSAQERKVILDTEISKQVQLGWKVASRDDTTAQLTKEKGPSMVIALLLLLIMILPGVLYLVLYKGQMTLYLEVDEQGSVQRTQQG